MAQVTNAIKFLMRKHGVCFIIADHHRKPGNFESNKMARVRGSTEKVAFVDSLLNVEKRDDTITIFHEKCRSDLPHPTIIAELSHSSDDTAIIRYIDDVKDYKRREKLGAAFEFLQNEIGDEWVTVEELLKRAKGFVPKAHIEQALKISVDDGQVILEKLKREGKGRPKHYYKKADRNNDHVASQVAKKWQFQV